jgi:hypothetical protein
MNTDRTKRKNPCSSVLIRGKTVLPPSPLHPIFMTFSHFCAIMIGIET